MIFLLLCIALACGVWVWKRHKDRTRREAWPEWAYRMRNCDWFWHLPPVFRERPWGWKFGNDETLTPPPAITNDSVPEAHALIGAWMISVCRDYGDMVTAARYLNRLISVASTHPEFGPVAKSLTLKFYERAQHLAAVYPDQAVALEKIVGGVG